MGKAYDAIDDRMAEFLAAQRLFFVATAPLAADGRVNASPKGLDGLRVLDEHTVAYLDLVGSGVETVAHVRENGRIVLLFCAFEGPPRIVRIHGRGEVLEPGDPGFDALRARFAEVPRESMVRSIVRVRAERISDSCGYGVPRYGYEGERSQLHEWGERKGDEGIAEYKRTRNRTSLDGLSALKSS